MRIPLQLHDQNLQECLEGECRDWVGYRRKGQVKWHCNNWNEIGKRVRLFRWIRRALWREVKRDWWTQSCARIHSGRGGTYKLKSPGLSASDDTPNNCDTTGANHPGVEVEEYVSSVILQNGEEARPWNRLLVMSAQVRNQQLLAMHMSSPYPIANCSNAKSWKTSKKTKEDDLMLEKC